MLTSKTAFRYSLTVLKIYILRHVHYRFLVLPVNIGTRPKSNAKTTKTQKMIHDILEFV